MKYSEDEYLLVVGSLYMEVMKLSSISQSLEQQVRDLQEELRGEDEDDSEEDGSEG